MRSRACGVCQDSQGQVARRGDPCCCACKVEIGLSKNPISVGERRLGSPATILPVTPLEEGPKRTEGSNSSEEALPQLSRIRLRSTTSLPAQNSLLDAGTIPKRPRPSCEIGRTPNGQSGGGSVLENRIARRSSQVFAMGAALPPSMTEPEPYHCTSSP
jgi:hypothetical protein